MWQPDISEASISGPLAAGAHFTWTTGGAKIHSRIALLEPGSRLAWTGTAFQAKAVHVWRLKRLPDGQTEITTEESMDGFLLGLFFSSEKLQENDRRWLEDLKQAAER